MGFYQMSIVFKPQYQPDIRTNNLALISQLTTIDNQTARSVVTATSTARDTYGSPLQTKFSVDSRRSSAPEMAAMFCDWRGGRVKEGPLLPVPHSHTRCSTVHSICSHEGPARTPERIEWTWPLLQGLVHQARQLITGARLKRCTCPRGGGGPRDHVNGFVRYDYRNKSLLHSETITLRLVLQGTRG